MVIFDEEKQDQKLDLLRKREEEELVQIMAAKYGVPYINLTSIPINMDALRLIPEAEAREGKIAAFDRVGKKVRVAFFSPNNEKAKQILNSLGDQGLELSLYMSATESLEKAWKRYSDLSYATETKAGALDVSGSDIEKTLSELSRLADVSAKMNEVLKMNKSARISHIVEIVLAGALALKASDVHIEPEETDIRLRFRLDGVLNDVIRFDHETYGLILSRIKLLSGLKLNIKSEAQDGRFSVKIGESDIEIRTSILPGAYNESIVLRILNPKSISVPLEELGIPPKLFSVLEHETKKPNGMILTTGPTGSGKTTTLYAFLKKVHTPDIKIITIEDPIEYHLPGIVQTQTNSEKGYSFLEGLRSALRQDPDIIMVGEIRDDETAEIAINAALTGHLVFSTLHTNTAAGTFPRLIDLGVDPKVISSALNIAMAQRLIRRLCTCKEETLPEGKEKDLIEKVVASLPEDEKKALTNTTKVWKAKGCEACNNTGYKGRIGIYEAIKMDPAIEEILRSNPSDREIKAAALPQGIIDMKQDGIIKILSGMTSIDELGRVIDLELDQ